MFRTILLAAAGATLFAASGAAAVTFAYTGAPQTYRVATTGIYDLRAEGGSGGNRHNPYFNIAFAQVFGAGGRMEASVLLGAGTRLEIIVGGAGGDAPGSAATGVLGGGGDGGGTFIFTGTSTPVMIVGGGGGFGRYTFDSASQGLSAPGSGNPAFPNGRNTYGQSSSGGVGGTGGGSGVQGVGGAGGAGLFGGGSDADDSNIFYVATSHGGSGPSSFAGGAGAVCYYPSLGYCGVTAAGGFGGGGAAGFAGGGGGGGFSGGGGGDDLGAGGGGAFLMAGATFLGSSSTPGGNGFGHDTNGFVTLDLLRAVQPVPEPATWSLMIVGFAAVGAVMRRRAARARPESHIVLDLAGGNLGVRTERPAASAGRQLRQLFVTPSTT